jgi:hypothetical protein
MMNSTNNEEVSEQGKVRRRETTLLQWGIVAFLWALIGLAFGVFWYASPMLAVLVVYGTYKLASYCQKRHQAYMLPPSFTARLRGSELYQIYVVRAVRRQGSHLLLWVATISFVFTLGNWIDSLNPVLDLTEMNVKTGTVIKVVKRQKVGTRKGCGDTVYLNAGDGSIIQYNGLLDSDALKILGGRATNDVTLWSQKVIKLPPCSVMNWIRQVQIKNQIVDSYNINRRKNFHRWILRLNFIYPAIGFLALFGIWVADKKSTINSHNIYRR